MRIIKHIARESRTALFDSVSSRWPASRAAAILKGSRTLPVPEIRQFKPLKKTLRCPACLKDSVEFESNYPSHTRPFSKCTIRYCTQCGTGNVPGSARLLEGYYEQEYARSNRGDRDIPPDEYFSEENATASRKMNRYFVRARRQIRLLKQKGAKVETLLDFGSGPGYCLHMSGAHEKFAFEPDESSTKYLDYLNATRFNALSEIKPNRFDSIVASHAIEHLVPEDLISTLETLLAALTDDGLFLIEVPQGGISYLDIRGEQDPHTIFFTPQGICEAVEKAGGEIIFRKAYSKIPVEHRANAIYEPTGRVFYKDQRGALTVICKKPGPA